MTVYTCIYLIILYRPQMCLRVNHRGWMHILGVYICAIHFYSRTFLIKPMVVFVYRLVYVVLYVCLGT